MYANSSGRSSANRRAELARKRAELAAIQERKALAEIEALEAEEEKHLATAVSRLICVQIG